MTIKELTQSVLKRLEEGTAEIYARYQALSAAADRAYETKSADLDQDYRKAANAASAQAKIGLNNTLEKMADSGYVKAGETVQATIAANSDRQNALGYLAAERLKGKSSLAVSKANEEAERSISQSREMSQLKAEAEQQILDLEKEERERIAKEEEAELARQEKARQEEIARQEKEWERQEKARQEELARQEKELERQAAEKQQEFENRLALEKLYLEKAKLASSSQTSKETKEDGFEPSKSAYTYLQEIVKNYTKTRTYDGKKQTYVDKNAVISAIGSIVKDENISRSYRYELYLYAKSLGYTAA